MNKWVKYYRFLEGELEELFDSELTPHKAEVISDILASLKCLKLFAEDGYKDYDKLYGDGSEAAHGGSERLTGDELAEWAKNLYNNDNTHGAHWTIGDVNSVVEKYDISLPDITETEFWLTMNMIYSDFCDVAEKHGVNNAEFYADMAKNWLYDEDAGVSPSQKLYCYYHYIVL